MTDDASFGRWLQRRRRALGLTQAQLGARVGVAAATIRKIEADERRPSRATAERMAEILGIAPERSAEFVLWARGQMLRLPAIVADLPKGATWRPHALSPSNLPVPPTPLVGREHEIAKLSALLDGSALRLLTLTGPGGIGKTRLGLAIAEALRARFSGGVWFVPLAPITDARLVLPTIARTLTVPDDGGPDPVAALQRRMQGRELLLLLDNCEQVLDAAGDISRLLAVVPRLAVLVTSRTRLHISGEHEFSVPPLAVVSPDLLPDLAAMSQYAAVELFIQRSQAVKADWAITSANAPAVADICYRLDGLPLAIELAAARSRLLSPQALLARLGNRLTLLTHGARDLPPRHQTLRATIDWSYNLLEAHEQQLFASMAVFVDSVTLDAVADVCSSDELPRDLVVDTVASLADQSMVRMLPGPEDELRCGMFETIREYALERLLASGQIEAVRRRHAEHFCQVAAHYDRHLRGTGQRTAMERLDADISNIRAAIRWAFESGDYTLGIQTMWSLCDYFFARGYRDDAAQQIEAVLKNTLDQLALVDRARALYIAARMAVERADIGAARRHYEASLPLWRITGDTTGLCWTLNDLGIILWEHDELPGAQAYLEQSLALKRTLGDLSDVAITLNNLAMVAKLQHDYARAEALMNECLELLKQDPFEAFYPVALSTMAHVAVNQDRLVRAEELLREALPLAFEQRHVMSMTDTMCVLIAIAARRGDLPQAARFAGMLRGINELAGAEFDLTPTSVRTFGEYIDAVRDTLDAAEFDRRFEQGRVLTHEQTLAEVLTYLNR